MKIEIPLTNAVRFETDESTVLHLHTGQVLASNITLVEPDVGPRLHLQRKDSNHKYPLVDSATPYGAGVGAILAFQFGQGVGQKNFGTTAGSENPILPSSLNLQNQLRLSLFLRPDESFSSGMRFIAGVPDRLGLYQNPQGFLLRLRTDSGWTDSQLDSSVEVGVWYLVEVQWNHDVAQNGGVPMWYVNGVRCAGVGPGVTDPLTSTGVAFNLAYDSTDPTGLFWKGAVRELELASAVLWDTDSTTTDRRFYARAMRLFGLATPTTPVPTFTRPSMAWVRVGGVRHRVSWHHPRSDAFGTLVEEARTNLFPVSSDPLALAMTIVVPAPGRYTFWFEQQSSETQQPVTIKVTVDGVARIAREPEPLVIEVISDLSVQFEKVDPLHSGMVTHLQLEAGVGPTSPIVTVAGMVTRAVETLAYPLTASDLDQEQGRLDLEVTPQLTGVRAEVGYEALAGDILSMSLTREEVVSVDGGGDAATLPGAGLWQALNTRRFHVEWQPGTRLLVEDTLGLVAGAEYSGAWPQGSGFFYLGGGGTSALRANAYFRNLVLDDQVSRFHADLHRFMVRQFGAGGFSADEGSTFRRWRRVEGDGLALQQRLGDTLKDQAFADTVDELLEEWEQALGLPTPVGATRAERQALLADLFKALGATDAELEERVAYLTGAAAVIERHLGDVGPDLREMYEYYIKIPESSFRDSVLGLLRYLIERQEPAHTFGWPVVRTEFVTSSEVYGAVSLGTDEPLVFDQLGSQTERDCVGLPSNFHLAPQGMWMPTNRVFNYADEWIKSYPALPVPSILFPFTEQGAPLHDYGATGVLLNMSGFPAFRRTCAGLLVADKTQDIETSVVKLNIRRGVELRDQDADRFCTTTNTEVLNLGSARSGAFLVVFRLAAWSDQARSYLFRCVYGDEQQGDYGNYYYGLFVDGQGRLVAEYKAGVTATEATTIVDTPISPGEWVCALLVIDQEGQNPDRRLQIFASHGTSPEVTGLEVQGASPTELKLCLGGDDSLSFGTRLSAMTHLAYFAGWVGPNAARMDLGVVNEIWRALNPLHGLIFKRAGNVPVAWPVGPTPDPEDVGDLACKVVGGQFPYAALGRRYDGDGLEQDIRGYGCNPEFENLLPYSEALREPQPVPVPVWTWFNLNGAGLGVSPEGLCRAQRFTYSNLSELFIEIASGAEDYLALSCWVRREPSSVNPVEGSVPVKLFVRDPNPDPQDPFVPAVVYSYPATPGATKDWQRIAAVFQPPNSSTPWPATIQVGLAVDTTEATPDDWLVIWGFQAVRAPVLGPYLQNTAETSGPAAPTRLSFDPDDFPGYQDRGFAAFRVKAEECFGRLVTGRPVVLFEAVNSDDPAANHSVLTLQRETEDDPVTLTFVLRFLIAPTTSWEDSVSAVLGTGERELDWSDPGVEHRIAVAWDLTRPVALTDRHVALWVDGVRAKTYAPSRPTDPMAQSLLLDTVHIGCGVLPGETGDPGHQPHAVFREVELYTRHHPGLYTPTRLSMRGAEE